MSSTTTCYICGDEFEGRGDVIPITVGFMTAFKHQAANTGYGVTRATRKNLLRRLAAVENHRGSMETPTPVCDECAGILADGEAGGGRRPGTDAVVPAGKCYSCKRPIRSGLAYRFQSARLATSSLGFFEYHLQGTRRDPGDYMTQLQAGLRELQALQAAPTAESKLVCESCVHHFSVSRKERDAATVTIQAKPWWRFW